jgi:2-polyprenyl-6-hydroxyphenyl methylase/3-demethylubiquinone-9 3-methyltransferase
MASGRNPFKYVAEYSRSRGMRWSNDVHDWLGGYQYESATPEEIDAVMRTIGFARETAILCEASRGVFGTGCNEFVYRAAS